jgi:hypothetical protein
MDGVTPAQAATIEAREEAGLLGQPLGRIQRPRPRLVTRQISKPSPAMRHGSAANCVRARRWCLLEMRSGSWIMRALGWFAFIVRVQSEIAQPRRGWQGRGARYLRHGGKEVALVKGASGMKEA